VCVCVFAHQLPLRKSLQQPTWTDIDVGKLDRSQQLHLGFNALDLWAQRHGSLPLPHHPVRIFPLVPFLQTEAMTTTPPGACPAGGRIGSRAQLLFPMGSVLSLPYCYSSPPDRMTAGRVLSLLVTTEGIGRSCGPRSDRSSCQRFAGRAFTHGTTQKKTQESIVFCASTNGLRRGGVGGGGGLTRGAAGVIHWGRGSARGVESVLGEIYPYPPVALL